MPATFIHFEALRARVASHPHAPIFKLPKPGALGREWVNVSYKDFQADIERMAKYWLTKLASQGLPPRSVVGVWVRGFTYSDVITIFAISRAGFIPQMFGFELPNTRIVYELLAKGAGKAIVHDPAKTTLLRESGTTLPCYVATDYTTISDADIAAFPLPDLPAAKPDDYLFIYHSSGSVSGMPKVVPQTNQWLETVQHKSRDAFCSGDFDTQDVFIWTESFSHALEICLLQLIFHLAGCLVQPTRIDFDSHELASLIRVAGVNRIIQFTGVLRRHLDDARGGVVEPGLLALLKQSRQVTYACMPLSPELEDWAVAQGIPMTNSFGCTECGGLLTSDIGDRRLRMLPNISYKMVPVGPTSIDGAEYGRLLELWILPDSPDLPIAALRTPDGGWRSGDLFEEPEPGKYLFRGRDDDWIKSQWSERLDTKAIEDNVYTTCADIVANCVVVGNGRPYPALFVEPRVPAATPAAELELKREIIKRTSDFHSLRYLHERIQVVRMIKIVPAKALPRTVVKGNIRRRAIEQNFASDLEAMYASFAQDEVYAGVCISEPPPKART
ncbi:acetyl-CoA synthetase-like protein [Gautieria morchelliformis]|nr:acetyl-CoA synthetase-like protein [Gautieria morchelliformis]